MVQYLLGEYDDVAIDVLETRQKSANESHMPSHCFCTDRFIHKTHLSLFCIKHGVSLFEHITC